MRFFGLPGTLLLVMLASVLFAYLGTGAPAHAGPPGQPVASPTRTATVLPQQNPARTTTPAAPPIPVPTGTAVSPQSPMPATTVSASRPAVTSTVRSALSPTAPVTATQRYFTATVSQASITPAPTPGQALQQVSGTVLARTGRGLDGVTVRAAWGNAQALTTTRDGGSFRFALAPGDYRIRLMGLLGDEVAITVSAQVRTAIEFREGERAVPTTTATATPTPTGTGTPTPTAPARPSATPTYSGSPAPGVGTPVGISIVAIRQPSPTVAPAAGPLNLPIPFTLPTDVDLDLETWSRTFLAGVGIGAVLAALGMVVVAIRHF